MFLPKLNSLNTPSLNESGANQLIKTIFKTYSIPYSLICYCKVSIIVTTSSKKYILIIFPKDKAYGNYNDYSRFFYKETELSSSKSLIKDAIYGNEILFNGDKNYKGKGIVYPNINIECQKNIIYKKIKLLQGLNSSQSNEEESKENYIIRKNEVVLSKKIPPGQSLLVFVKNGTFSSKGDYIMLNRKGSHIISGILKELESRDEIGLFGLGSISMTTMVKPRTSFIRYTVYNTNFNCQYQNKCYEYLHSQGFDFRYFDNRGNRCFCKTCFPEDWINHQIIANETYVHPRGWCRFGLKVPYFFSELNKIWSSWCNAFHGTDPLAAKSIIEHKTLLLNGDLTQHGNIIPENDSKEAGNYFISPHICYASHPWYCKIIKIPKDGKNRYAQIAVAIKIRSNSYSKQIETERGAKKKIYDYRIILRMKLSGIVREEAALFLMAFW